MRKTQLNHLAENIENLEDAIHKIKQQSSSYSWRQQERTQQCHLRRRILQGHHLLLPRRSDAMKKTTPRGEDKRLISYIPGLFSIDVAPALSGTEITT